ncbi:hypothetical protein ACFVAD_22895 [Sutcliffiella sp. NPDC057660]|uniref:hypothetical protein n=1 Tax=Sutcliffiella sp. NPDC057660 TaxID=3346199 RepID=UPI0036B79826
MNRKVLAVCITLSMVTVPMGSFYLYLLSGEKTRHEATLSYLKEDRGYKQNEIKSVEVEYSIMSVLFSYHPWAIKVVYEDEPSAIYYYHYEDGVMSQSRLSGSNPDELYHHLEDAPPDIKKNKN